MDDAIGRIRRRIHEAWKIWRPPFEAMLAARAPGGSTTISSLLTLALSGGPEARSAKRTLSRCGIEFGNLRDFAAIHWWRHDRPCVAILCDEIGKSLLAGTPWENSSADDLESSLGEIPRSITHEEPDAAPVIPMVLLSHSTMRDLLNGRLGGVKCPGSPDGD
jgi:hypothetical protein